MRPWILALLLLVPASALALDCTPDFNWTCTTNGFFNYLSGQPGEVICGVDHTGWTLNVVSVTLTTGGWVHFAAAAASEGPGTGVANAIYLMDDCGTGTCTDSAQSSGVADLIVCLEPGTHTFVVATDTTAPGAVINMGMQCLTCEQADTYGLGACAACGAVSVERESWGSLKSRFQ